MRNRAFRPIAVILSLLLLAAVPAQAGPIQFAEVVHVLGDMHSGTQTQELRLRSVTQEPGTPLSSAPSTLQGSPAETTETASVAEPLSLIGGTEVAPQQQSNVEVIEQDNIEGTICDCGEIPGVGGGFPKWPLLALIPLICVTGICHGDHKETPTPTPPPTETPVPEPASLLLFGSGMTALAAGARRRYARLKARRNETTVRED
jgi:PEP-CTERM motif-containing protein